LALLFSADERFEFCRSALMLLNPRIPQQLRNLAPGRDCFSRVVYVLEGILVTLRGARRHPAVHPASPLTGKGCRSLSALHTAG
jgi:hypothetical protein